MTSIFRQAFLNTSWGWQSSFGGWFSRTPSIPSWERFTWHSPVPVHVPLPPQIPTISTSKVETTSSTVWVDYQGNKYTTQAQLQSQLKEEFLSEWGDIDPAIIDRLAKVWAWKFAKMIEQDAKWNSSHAHYAIWAPEWTTWSDLEFYLSEYQKRAPGNTFFDIKIKWEFFDKHVSMHDLGLEDTVNNDFSVTWKMLLYLCSWREFIWESSRVPDKYKKIKQRFCEELKNTFCIPWDPLIIADNKYVPQFQTWGNYSSSVMITNDVNVDWL